MAVLMTVLAVAACQQGVDVDRAGGPSVPPPGSSVGDTGRTHAAGAPRLDAPEPGFTSLLRGDEQRLRGWEHIGAGRFVSTPSGVRTSGGIGLLWYAIKPVRDFELRLQWRVASADDNSGVFVRFPAPTDAADVVPGGLEIQIYDGASGDPQKTGALYDVQPARRRNSNPPGTWNDYRIRVVGNRVTVVLNGRVVNTYEAPTGTLPASGHVGLQNHGPDDVVWFRRVRIRELGA